MKIFKTDGELIDGIYCFIHLHQLKGDNLKFAKLYNRISWIYNFSGRIFYWLKFGGEKKFREEFLKELNIKVGDLVLETSVGTGDNFKFLNKNAVYFGVDISFNMLKKAQQHLKRWGMIATLVNCEAENLPFTDNAFDVVFHCGGINFYNDKQQAIDEMIRVAKPGTKILIVDETEKTVKEIYRKNLHKKFYDADKAFAPIEFIPKNMLNVDAKIICNGYMYAVSFQKPT